MPKRIDNGKDFPLVIGPIIEMIFPYLTPYLRVMVDELGHWTINHLAYLPPTFCSIEQDICPFMFKYYSLSDLHHKSQCCSSYTYA